MLKRLKPFLQLADVGEEIVPKNKMAVVFFVKKLWHNLLGPKEKEDVSFVFCIGFFQSDF